MEEISLRELQLLELEILKEFDKYCRKNNLSYMLAAGTLLGAVRHEGFIPWDDDIDILMPREDYEVFRDNFTHERYSVKSIKNTIGWPYSFSKCIDTKTELEESVHEVEPIGVFIDIFPLDGLPENTVLSKIHFLKLCVLKGILAYGLIANRPKKEKRLIKIIKGSISKACRLFNREKVINRIDSLASKYPYRNSKYVAHQVLGYGFKERIEKIKMDSYKEFRFESGYYYGPIGYDDYLTNLFGEYMVLPPIEKRISHEFYSVKYKTN